MQLPLDTYIAGRKTIGDWLVVRASLDDFTLHDIWAKVFDDYFINRLQDRYLAPLDSIKSGGSYVGEGFAIMAIICSLIEFIESTYQGTNYKHRRRGDPPLQPFEYSGSESLFSDFLTGHEPFRSFFDRQLATSFYKNVRCGLLHEARTNGRWTIWGKSHNGSLLQLQGQDFIVFRDNFHSAIRNFIEVEYKQELISSDERKSAFLRKFDRLCYE
ncbi:hypothetical protein [Chryseosolibacter indicus]|uniref:Uncharacterized protein n=1 Tax=Chryseosolibacter indicus TaxID=2782351 RepID=A0ABS5VY61_9BACT|nr:hypothetical protein [Chryseosolibacter indicus]MBT1706348.1 hypothetical protein [Chryseosolibacter indicus]